jgi:5-dehydro-2-deoxygluconokinase
MRERSRGGRRVNRQGQPELIAMGRVSIDFYPEEIGVPLGEARTFTRSLGGAAANVAVAAARLGTRSALITKVGNDSFGPYVKQKLSELGVSTRWVGDDVSLRTPLAFCELHPPADFPILHYRQPTAPDVQVHSQELDLQAIAAAPCFWLAASSLAEEPSRGATLTALAHRERGRHTVLDLDYHPRIWPSLADARRWTQEAVTMATVVVGTQPEVEMATGVRKAETSAGWLLDKGVSMAVLKLGKKGVFAATSAATVAVRPTWTDVVCDLGRSDAFGGALCHGLLAGWPLPQIITFAQAAAGLVASRLTSAESMPDLAEVEAALRPAQAN